MSFCALSVFIVTIFGFVARDFKFRKSLIRILWYTIFKDIIMLNLNISFVSLA